MDDTIELDAPSYELTGVFRGGSVAIHVRGAKSAERLRATVRDIAKALPSCK